MSNNTGRPRKEGPRYPNGKLKPPAPNAEVISRRRHMLGVTDPKTKVDLSKAENPMSLALARGWLSETQHRAGERYAAAYRLNTMGAPRPLSGAGLHESPGTGAVDYRSYSETPSAEIVEAWDAVFSERTPEATEQARKDARARYLAMTSRMNAAEQHQVFRCFILQEWPAWIDQRINAVPDSRAEREYALLVCGLDALSRRPIAKH